MPDVPDFEKQWIDDDVAALRELGLPRIQAWLQRRADVLGFGELAMSNDDPDRLGQRLMFGLAVIGNEPRRGHAGVDGVQELWERLAASDAHQLISARAARNLWRERCGTAPHEHGRRAIALFEAVANGSAGRACERAMARVDAIELAAEMRADTDVARLVTDALSTLAHELAACHLLQREHPRSADTRASREPLSMGEWSNGAADDLDATQHHGACLHLLRGFVTLEAGRYRSTVDHSRVVAAADRLAELVSARDMWARQLLDVRLTLAHGGVDERKRVVAEHIGWVRSIVDADGARRYVTLMQCEELARDTGLINLAGDLRVELQRFTTDDLGLESVRATVPIPPEFLALAAATVETICADDTLISCLRRLALDGVSRWRNAVTRREQPLPPTPLADSLPSVTLGHHGAPARRTEAGHADPQVEHARWEMAAIRLEVDMVVIPALRTMLGASHDELVDAMLTLGKKTGLLDDDRAISCADALRDWHEGRTDAALHAVVPRIEHAVRRAAEQRKLPIITPTDGTSRGGHDTLGQVLDTLAGHADPDLLLHLRTVLVDDAGLNLRNDVAHGDIPRGDERTSAIAIHTLLLALVGLETTDWHPD